MLSVSLLDSKFGSSSITAGNYCSKDTPDNNRRHGVLMKSGIRENVAELLGEITVLPGTFRRRSQPLPQLRRIIGFPYQRMNKNNEYLSEQCVLRNIFHLQLLGIASVTKLYIPYRSSYYEYCSTSAYFIAQ